MSGLPPRTDPAPRGEQSVAESTLFSSRDILVATLLGSVLAGSVLLGLNYLALRRQSAALLSIILGTCALAAVVVAVIVLGVDVLPGSPLWGGLFIAAGTAVAMSALAGALQGRALSAHQETGGRVGASGRSVVIGAVALVTVGGALFIALALAPALGPGDSVQVGNLTVYYKNGITESEARRTADLLHEHGLGDKLIEIRLRRVDGTPHIRLNTDARDTGGAFRSLGRAIALHTFDGVPVVVDLGTEERGIHESIEVDAK